MRRAVAFLTPLGGAAAPDQRAVAWFPVVGALVGVAVGTVWWAASRIWHPALAAAVVVAVDLALTGLLHLDGLIDSADGLLPPLDRARRLEVMADPRAGAFGVATATVILLLRWAAFATVPEASVWLVAGLWCVSRTVMAVSIRALPYARAGGLAESFRGGATRPARPLAVAGLGLGAVLAATWDLVPGLVAVGSALIAAAAVLALALRRLGGYTGDVLGAAGLVGETIGLVVAAARW